MIKRFFSLTIVCLFSQNLWASQPKGFLWYNLPHEQKSSENAKPQGVPFSQLSYTMRDKVLHFYTMEALHKARQTRQLEDVRAFLILQDYWMKEASRFAGLFQKALLYYPELDYTVIHPTTSNIGTKWLDEYRQTAHQKAIQHLAKTHGLLFFYRGNHALDRKQIPIIRDFSERLGLTLIPVSVDGVISPELPNSRDDKGQANALKLRYFPAILLVNPKTQTILPVAYGLTTQDVLAKRLSQVAQWRRS